jgi:hypothetical protein
MFDARDGDLDREVRRHVFMSIGKPKPARRPAMTLRLALLVVLLGLVILLGLAELAGAAGVERPVGKPVQKATGGQGPRQVTPSEKFPQNNGRLSREALYNFLQNFPIGRSGPEAAHQAQERQVPLQLFPVTNNLEAPLLTGSRDDAPWPLIVALAVVLWLALVGSVRARRPW